MGVDTADPERARQQKEHEPWLRMLPPTVVTVAGQTAWVPVHVTDGDPVEVWVELEDGSARRADQVDHWVEPREIEGSRIGEATFAVPADLPLGYHQLRARSGDTEAERAPDRHAGLARPARAGRPQAPVGVRHPALQRPLRRQLGARRPHRPHRPGRVVGERARRRLRPGQPAARRRAAGAAGAVAVPAQLAQVLQPDLPPRRADPGVRRPAPARARRGRPAGRAAAAVADSAGPGRPRRELDGEARRPADRPRRAAERRARARLRGVPQAGGRRARRLRHVERARRGPRQRRPRLAGRLPAPRQPGRAGVRAATTRTGSTSSAGCSGCSTSSSSRRRPRPRAPG